MRRALVTGWFGFESMGATAGDIITANVALRWLAEAGYSPELAVAAPFSGDLLLADADPSRYTHFVFVCGPFGRNDLTLDLLGRFDHCVKIGLNLTMLEPMSAWNPFDVLLERDSDTTSRVDLSFAEIVDPVPVVGLVLVKPQSEYGDRGRHAQVKQAFLELCRARNGALLPVDTRLDLNAGHLREASEVVTLISRCDLVLTTRLHGMVLSIAQGVPPLVVDPVSGGDKVARQARCLGWPCIHSADRLDLEDLTRAWDWCLGAEARQAVRRCARLARRQVLAQHGEFMAALGGRKATVSEGD